MIHRRLSLSSVSLSSLSFLAPVAAGSVQWDDLGSVLSSEDILVAALPQVIGMINAVFLLLPQSMELYCFLSITISLLSNHLVFDRVTCHVHLKNALVLFSNDRP